jgi:hypothetical protein
MSSENTVAQKMERIQAIFREVQDSYPHSPAPDSYDAEFRSIAYEAMSMCIALHDLKTEQQLNKWFDFLNKSGIAHATQIHVGLGWALAQTETDISVILPELDPMMRYRVVDGYGYYDGIFRRRKSILNQQKPEFTDPVACAAYDQGLGRSMWYLNNGVIAGAKAMLQKLPAERHTDLWRGMGIATVYVGGCNEETLREIAQSAEKYIPQLAAGAAMALVSRHYAGFISDSNALVASTICHRPVEEILSANEALRSNLDLNGEDAYMKWVDELESTFSS